MDEQNKEEKDESVKDIARKTKDTAKDTVKVVKNIKEAVTVIASFINTIPLIVIIIGVVLLGSFFYKIIDYFTDVNNQMALKVEHEYCTIEDDGIHFNKLLFLEDLDKALEDGQIRLNELKLGNENLTKKYLLYFYEKALETILPDIKGSPQKGIIKIKRVSGTDINTAKELQYIRYEEFQKMKENPTNEIKNYYSLDEQWNVCVYQVNTTMVNNELQDYEVEEVAIPYKTMILQYAMPANFITILQSITANAEYVMKVVELLDENSRIDLTIFDTVTKTTIIDTYTAEEYRKEKRDVIDPLTGQATGGYTISEPLGPTDIENVTETVIQEEKIKANVTYVRSWLIDQNTEYECIQMPDNITEELQELGSDSPPEEEGSWQINKKRNIKTTVQNYEWISQHTETAIKADEFLRLWRNGTKRYNKNLRYDKDAVDVVEYPLPDHREQSKQSNEEIIKSNILNEERIPQNCTYASPLPNFKSAKQMFYTFLEKDESTQYQAILMRYLVKLYEDRVEVPSGLEDDNGIGIDAGQIDINIFNPAEFVGTTFNGDFDVHDESLFITDVQQLMKAFQGGYSGNERLIEEAEAFLDMQNKYKVNAIFAASVSITETSAGRAGNAVNGHNNWFNIRGTGTSWRRYGSAAESIDDFGKLIALGKYYYQQGRYTVRTIGPIYCPNTTDHPQQADKWVEDTLAQIERFYKAAGIKIDINNEEDIENQGPYTGGNDLNSLFPDGIPKTEAEMQKYLVTIEVPVNTKSGGTGSKSITVHRSVAGDVKNIFSEIQTSGFVAYSIGGYSWRGAAGNSKSRSHHSYGVAIDINPRENYMIKNGQIIAGSFWKPGEDPYSITPNGPLVRAFNKRGWTWGGTWKSSKDYMHFSLTGH